MEHQHRTIGVTTIPPAGGFQIKVLSRDRESVLFLGETNPAGKWSEQTEVDGNTEITLVLTDADGKDVIVCNTFLKNLNPMDCLWKSIPKLSNDEVHKRFRKKYRQMQAKGIKNPDPEMVARQAFEITK